MNEGWKCPESAADMKLLRDAQHAEHQRAVKAEAERDAARSERDTIMKINNGWAQEAEALKEELAAYRYALEQTDPAAAEDIAATIAIDRDFDAALAKGKP